MYILLIIPGIMVLLIATLYFILKRKFYSAAICFAIAAVLNYATQQIPINVTSTSQTEAKTIRILEYNICGKNEYEIKHHEDFINYIIDQDADILVLPENSIYKAMSLDSVLLSHYPYDIRSTMGHKAPDFNLLFSKYPIEEAVRLKDIETNKLSHNNVEAILDINGIKITLFCIHAHSNSSGIKTGYKMRSLELQVFVDSIRNRKTKEYLVVGDFNDLSGSKFIRSLQKEGLRDAWWDKGNGFGFTYIDGFKRFRLDHIMVSSKICINKIMVDDSPEFSDHRPLITEIEIII